MEKNFHGGFSLTIPLFLGFQFQWYYVEMTMMMILGMEAMVASTYSPYYVSALGQMGTSIFSYGPDNHLS